MLCQLARGHVPDALKNLAFKLIQQFFQRGLQIPRPPPLLRRGDHVRWQRSGDGGDVFFHDVFKPLRVGHKAAEFCLTRLRDAGLGDLVSVREFSLARSEQKGARTN